MHRESSGRITTDNCSFGGVGSGPRGHLFCQYCLNIYKTVWTHEPFAELQYTATQAAQDNRRSCHSQGLCCEWYPPQAGHYTSITTRYYHPSACVIRNKFKWRRWTLNQCEETFWGDVNFYILIGIVSGRKLYTFFATHPTIQDTCAFYYP